MSIKIRIRKFEVGLLFRHGDFQRLLGPGAYFLPGRLIGARRVVIANTLDTQFRHPLLDLLLKQSVVSERLEVVDLSDAQRALVFREGRLAYILGPGRYAFWKQPYKLEVEVFDVDGVNGLRLRHPRIETILAIPDASKFLQAIRVESHEKILVFHNGKLIETFGPGLYAHWLGSGQVTWKAVDLREQVIDVAGQEIMTADKVTLRLNLILTIRVEDPEKAVMSVTDYQQALYREAQLALRAAVGQRQLESLLTDKEAVGADLLRRREETAAARSQANTARLLADNPVLARMKELETLQEILAGAKASFVFGRGNLTEEMRKLVANGDEDS